MSSTGHMNGLLDHMDAVLQERVPRLYKSLNPPATEAQIKWAEDMLGMDFPIDLRAAYMRHNGQRCVGSPVGWLDIERVVRQAEENAEVLRGLLKDGCEDILQAPAVIGQNQKTRLDWWSSRWIPFSRNSSGWQVCVDMDPAPAGVVGQVFGWSSLRLSETDGTVTQADSFFEFVEFFLIEVKSDRLDSTFFMF